MQLLSSEALHKVEPSGENANDVIECLNLKFV